MKAIAIMMRPDVQARLPQHINYAPAAAASDRPNFQGAGGATPSSPRTSAGLPANGLVGQGNDEMVKRFDAFTQK
jgi:hypothetical protein